MKRSVLILAVVLALLSIGATFAQGTPAQIQRAKDYTGMKLQTQQAKSMHSKKYQVMRAKRAFTMKQRMEGKRMMTPAQRAKMSYMMKMKQMRTRKTSQGYSAGMKMAGCPMCAKM